jgi:hypothetical protein
MARRFAAHGSAVNAEQGVVGAGWVVGAIRISMMRVATDAVCCRDHKEDLPLRIRVAESTISLAAEASANRLVPIVAELFDPPPLWCCAYLIQIEIVASVCRFPANVLRA